MVLKDSTMKYAKYFSLLEKHEMRPTPPEVYNWRIYWAAVLASWVAVIIGYDAGFVGGMVSLNSFISEFGLDKMTAAKKSWTSSTIVSLFQAGAFFGALFVYPVGYKFGRRISLWLAAIILMIGSGIQLAANSDRGLGPMYAGRVITGFGIGAVSNVAPMYIAEVSPAAIRGRLVGFYEISWQVGGVIGFWINYGTSVNIPDNEAKQWQIPVAIQLIPTGIFLAGLITLPESPRWLFSVNKREKGIKSLCYLRQLPEENDYIQYEIHVFEDEIQQRVEKVGIGMFDPLRRLFFTKRYLYRLLLTTSSFIMQNTLAVNAVNYYSPKIFEAMGVSGLNSSLLSTGIFGIIKGVSCFIWSVLIVDRVGRRPALIVGFIVCAFCFFYIGAYIKIADPSARVARGDTHIDSGGQCALALFYIWTIGYALSWSGTPWVWNAEVFDTTLRNVTSAINAASNWFWAFILARFTNQMISRMGYGIFLFFAAMMMFFLPIFYLLYPETKNIPSEYIDDLFTHRAWKAHSIVMNKIVEDRKLEEKENDSIPDETHEFEETEKIVDDQLSAVEKFPNSLSYV